MLDFADPQQKSRYNIKLVSRYSTCYCKLVWPEYYLASSAKQVVRAMLVREVEINLNLSNCCLFRYMMVYMYRGPTDNHVRQANKIQFDLFFILLWWLLITVNRGTRWQHHQSSYQVAKPTDLQRKSINKQHQNVTAGRVWLSQVFLYVPLAEFFGSGDWLCKECMQIRYPQNHQKSPNVWKEQYLVGKKKQHFCITI